MRQKSHIKNTYVPQRKKNYLPDTQYGKYVLY